MIIKIIPETDKEKEAGVEVEHKNVKEYFIFGNKQDPDGDLLDFHDWHGAYRFLLGSLGYFQTIISDERRAREVPDGRMRMMPNIDAGGPRPQMIKYGVQDGKPQIIDVETPPSQTQEAQGAPEIEIKTDAPDLKLL